MYAIRSYYGKNRAAFALVRSSQSNAASRSIASSSVITSYSIHYTKLYEGVVSLSVPLTVSVSRGSTWGEIH